MTDQWIDHKKWLKDGLVMFLKKDISIIEKYKHLNPVQIQAEIDELSSDLKRVEEA